MNKTLTLLSLIILTSSCVREPEACFEIEKQVYSRNEAIKFFNCSKRAERTEWDFGDGNVSTDYSPSYKYDNPGNYTAILRTYNDAGEDDFTFNISVGRYAVKSFTVDSIRDTLTYPRVVLGEYAALTDFVHGWKYITGKGPDCLNLNIPGGYNLTKPNLCIIHIYDIVDSESNATIATRLLDTLFIDTNVSVNLDQKRRYEDLHFYGKTETLIVDLEYELIIPNS